MRIILDIEANGLKPDKIWCAVAQDIDTDKMYYFDKVWLNASPLQRFLAEATSMVGHNFLGYDLAVLNKLLRAGLFPDKVIDTLVVSRLINFRNPGGHSLENWGTYFGTIKPEQEQWDVYEDKMLYRCEQDVLINRKLFDLHRKYIESDVWKLAMKIEHSSADYCRRLSENGFPFDIKAAKVLQQTWEAELQTLLEAFQRDFPPRYELVREITPVLTKSGKLHSKDFRWYDGIPDSGFSAGASFSLVRPLIFDPASKQQCIDRLWEAGWKPIERTDGHKDFLKLRKRDRDPIRGDHFARYGWKLSKLNLDSLKPDAAPGAHGLVRWLELTGLLNALKGWIELYDPDTNRIHGRFHSIGAWSGRMAHSNPNMANASTLGEVRSLWTSTNNTVLVGCDAAGIQLRVLAHYINDERFTHALVFGDKKTHDDIHTRNAQALGRICLTRASPRDDAKTFIYAFLLGAGVGKVAEIFECNTRDAQAAVDSFVSAYPGLLDLKQTRIPRDAKRGYFEGLDGRFVRQSEERLILAGYLQNGESVIMRLARMKWEDVLRKANIWYEPVNHIHDEWQTLAKPEDADFIGQTQAAAIAWAGNRLNLNCPMAGEYKIGTDWSLTH
jgi:DNA polymerase-1